jgi:hypothetical protein
VTGTVKRSLGRPGCWLCSLPQNDHLNIELFEIGSSFAARSYRQQRRQVIEDCLASDRRPEAQALTARQVRDHYGFHHFEQPVPNLRSLRNRAPEIEEQLNERDWMVLQFVGQNKQTTAQQLADLFWTTSPEKRRLMQARKQVQRLRAMHLLYVVPRRKIVKRALTLKEGEKKSERIDVILLGKGGAVLLARLFNTSVEDWKGQLTKSEQLGNLHLRHNLGVIQLYIDAQRSAGSCLVDGARGHVEVVPLDCWSAPYLDVAVRLGMQIDPDGQKFDAFKAELEPDGLLMLRVTRRGTTHLMPMVIENDSGNRNAGEVGDQIANYDLLARSGALQKRLPDLAVPDYKIPTFFVTDYYPRPNDWNKDPRSRVQDLRRAAARSYKRRGYRSSDKIAPTFIVFRQDWRELGVKAPAWDTRRPQQDADECESVLDVAFRTSMPLFASGQLDAARQLRIDFGAAAWHGPKVEGQQKSAAKRKAEVRHQQVVAADIEALRQQSRAVIGGGDR